MYEITFTEVYFEDCDYWKATKLIVARNTKELFNIFFDFDKLSIFIYTCKVVNSITNYQEACRKAGAVIVLEKKKKITCDEATQLIYGFRS